jgi:methylmalonyl-CoA mutase
MADAKGHTHSPGDVAVEALYTSLPAHRTPPRLGAYEGIIAARVAVSQLPDALEHIKDAASDGAESVTIVIADGQCAVSEAPGEGILLQGPEELFKILGVVSENRMSAVLECGISGAAVLRLLQSCDPAHQQVVTAVRGEPAFVSPAGIDREWTALSEAAEGVSTVGSWHCLDVRPIAESGGSEVQELACALSLLASRLRQAQGAGVNPERVLCASRVLCATGSEVFLESAKLRAMRVLLDLFAQKCGTSFQVPLEVCSARWNRTRDEPHMNILRAAAALLAARSAGIERVELHPFVWGENPEESLARQVAIGTQHILRHEAALGTRSDLMEGCFYVETLTMRLAEQAWELFRSYESHGGCEWMVQDRTFTESVAAVANVRAARVIGGSDVFVGLNRFRADAGRTIPPSTRASPKSCASPRVEFEKERRSFSHMLMLQNFCVQRAHDAATSSASYDATIPDRAWPDKSGEKR